MFYIENCNRRLKLLKVEGYKMAETNGLYESAED